MNRDPQQILFPELAAAVSRGDADAVRRLLEAGADPETIDERGWPVLFLALDERFHEIVKLLLDAGADPHATFQGTSTALMATFRGDLNSLDLLIARGVDLNLPGPEGDVPLKVAAAGGEISLARILLQAGADKEYAGGTDDMSVLGSAVAHGRSEMVALLLEHGCDPNRRDAVRLLPVDRIGPNLEHLQRQRMIELLRNRA